MTAVMIVTAAALLVLQGVTFAVALKAGKHSVVDTAWGIGVALAGLVAFLASLNHGDPTRRALLLGTSALWGTRLAVYVGYRNQGKPEDPRYADMLAKPSRGKGLYALRRIYLPQWAILWLATVPVQLGMLEGDPAGALAVTGTVFLQSASYSSHSATGSWPASRPGRPATGRPWTPACGATPASELLHLAPERGAPDARAPVRVCRHVCQAT